MKTTINDRILMLKNESGLSNLDFCYKAKISNGTLHNIQQGENVSAKTISTLCEALNLNREWLINGRGAIYNEMPKDPAPALNPGIEQALNNLQQLFSEQIRKKDEQIASLLAIVSKVNFHNLLEKTGSNKSGFLKVAA